MKPDAFLEHLRADADRMAELAGHDLDAEVPPCPGWDVREVMTHTGAVYSHKVACMRSKGARPEDDDWTAEPAEGEDLVSWFRTRLEELVTELEAARPGGAAFTWYDAAPERRVLVSAGWRRRPPCTGSTSRARSTR